MKKLFLASLITSLFSQNVFAEPVEIDGCVLSIYSENKTSYVNLNTESLHFRKKDSETILSFTLTGPQITISDSLAVKIAKQFKACNKS